MSTLSSYTISLSSSARRELRRLDRQVISRIGRAIDLLTTNPRPPGGIKVKTKEGLWRIRVGDWRIGYEIDDVASIVTIITIGHRREFYD
jgi:mRNA interferase RelE/StbE